MPRTPLAPISGNKPRGNELSQYMRGKIEFAAEIGAPRAEIAKTLNLPLTTVKYTLSKASQRHNGESLPRSGRPKEYSERDERAIVRIARRNPRIKYRDLILQAGIDLYRKTIYRILCEHGIKKWLAKKRPLLTEEHAKARL